MVADHSVLFRAEPLDGTLRREVEVVGAQRDHLAAEGLERVMEQQQLAGGVDVCSLPAPAVPGIADLHAIDRGDDVVIARGPDNPALRQLAHRPWQHLPGALAVDGGLDVGIDRVRLGHRGKPELPQAAIGRGGAQRISVRRVQWFEPDSVPLQLDRCGCDHAVSGRRAPRRPRPRCRHGPRPHGPP